MKRTNWRIGWSIAGGLVLLQSFAAGDEFTRWQNAHPWWAVAVVLAALQIVVAGTIWVVLHESENARTAHRHAR